MTALMTIDDNNHNNTHNDTQRHDTTANNDSDTTADNDNNTTATTPTTIRWRLKNCHNGDSDGDDVTMTMRR